MGYFRERVHVVEEDPTAKGRIAEGRLDEVRQLGTDGVNTAVLIGGQVKKIILIVYIEVVEFGVGFEEVHGKGRFADAMRSEDEKVGGIFQGFGTYVHGLILAI